MRLDGARVGCRRGFSFFGAEVSVELEENGFGFGCAAAADISLRVRLSPPCATMGRRIGTGSADCALTLRGVAGGPIRPNVGCGSRLFEGPTGLDGDEADTDRPDRRDGEPGIV